MKFGTKSLIALAAVAGIHTAASAVVIDSFDTPLGGQSSFEPPSGPGVSVPLPLDDSVIGDFRYIDVERISGPGQVRLDINNVVPGVAAISSDTATAGTFTFAYGNLNPLAPIALDADLLADGSDSIMVKILQSDNLYAIEFTLRDGAGATQVVTKPVPANLGPQTMTFLFSEFAGLDFADIDGIQMRAIGTANLDTQIDLIGTSTSIPVPAAVWAGGALLGGIVVRRLRRKA